MKSMDAVVANLGDATRGYNSQRLGTWKFLAACPAAGLALFAVGLLPLASAVHGPSGLLMSTATQHGDHTTDLDNQFLLSCRDVLQCLYFVE